MDDNFYGYWLREDGSLVKVEPYEHEQCAISFGFYEKPVLNAILAGNIRILIRNEEICVSLTSLTDKQRENIIDLLKTDNFNSYLFDYNGKVHKFISRDKAIMFFNLFRD